MRQWLKQLPERMEAYEEVAQEQRRRGSKARELLYEDELLSKREILNEKLGAINNGIVVLSQQTPEPRDAWMSQVATPDEREVLSDLAKMESSFMRHNLMSTDDQARWQQRINRLRGTLFWKQVVEAPARIRTLENARNETEAFLQDVDARIAKVQSAESNFVAGVETNFLAFNERAERIIATVEHAVDSREEMLASQIRQGMQREILQVQQYLLITRIAVARASDQIALSETVPPPS